ncbi:hypothetical protein B6U61_08675 [Ligilactobacillus salivarius]|nr:hypothetical protein B6U61_08675 [Ligilactobacillus salivarius]
MHKISKFRILDFRGGDSQEFFSVSNGTNDGKLQYLELQAPSDHIIGGWQEFEEHLGINIKR